MAAVNYAMLAATAQSRCPVVGKPRERSEKSNVSREKSNPKHGTERQHFDN
jgi:hypothetical protein